MCPDARLSMPEMPEMLDLQAQSYLFIYFYLAAFVGFVLISTGHRAAYMYVLCCTRSP